MLNAAVEDGVVLTNVAARLRRSLRLAKRPAERQREVHAMTREQLTALLSEASKKGVQTHALFLLLARTGLRIGEVRGLQWEDLDFADRAVHVRRAWSADSLETPKSGKARRVDMSRQLGEALQRLQVARKKETLKRGWRTIPAWVFCTEAGTPLDESRVRKVLGDLLKDAKLPHFRVHDFRHTFASLLIQNGESLAYVRDQLGHASIQITVDTYGHLVPGGNRGAVDRLDDSRGSKVVANAGDGPASPSPDAADSPASSTVSENGPPQTRTGDPLIKSQLL